MMAMLNAARESPAQGAGWVAGCVVLLGATAWLTPALLPDLIASLLALSGVVLVWRHFTASWAIWVLVAGLSLEMSLIDLIGPGAFQPTIAAVKGAEIGLVALTIVRYGVAPDWFNPAFGFALIAAMGFVVGTDPALTPADVARSLLGSITPFLLFFCVKPAGWGSALQRAVAFTPLLSVVLASILDV